ncbi:periplasmic heavy metal sensor [Hyphomicrobium sp.]|uniref:periplasmic heavy metal sensor n=1 Tax=Hyphomicrobium sp. TaxID=82 RepID=UPI000F9CD6A9|nr:periplasmic heavy metal sensor [Hyphomicrobium sp.]RUO99174.1 MAG: periplasmic heavy metal sensor [Hyphomicrobium sp.]
MTVEANRSSPADRSRYLYMGFIASLAVNLLFVGLSAAVVWHHHQEEEQPRRDMGFLGFVNKLAPDRQPIIKAKVMSDRAAMKDLRANMRKTWIEANDLLTAEPFDKAKFLAALMKLRTAEDNFKNAIYTSVADTAETLTPDERKLLQEWREKRHARILIQPPPGEASNNAKP